MKTDILVVGDGTAGAFIAGRLVERTDARVILLEDNCWFHSDTSTSLGQTQGLVAEFGQY